MIIGITGGIGSGKSTVSRLLSKQLGSPIVSCDKIVAELWGVHPDRMRHELVDAFGSIHRDSLFPKDDILAEHTVDTTFLQVLSDIFSDYVYKQVAPLADEPDMYIVEIPLLFESSRDFVNLCKATVTVNCDLRTRRRRVVARNGIYPLFDPMVAFQMTDEERTDLATYSVNNGEPLVYLTQQMETIARLIGNYGKVF